MEWNRNRPLGLKLDDEEEEEEEEENKIYCYSQDCSLRIETDTGWTAGVRFEAVEEVIFLLHIAQAGSGAHRASYPVGMGKVLFPRAKGP
jgi:hypothetical protein